MSPPRSSYYLAPAQATHLLVPVYQPTLQPPTPSLEPHRSAISPSCPTSSAPGLHTRLRRGPWPWHTTPHSSDAVGVLSLSCCARDLHTHLGSFSLENLILGLILPCYLYPVNNSPSSKPEHNLSTTQQCTSCPTSYPLLVTLVPCMRQQRQAHQVPGRSEHGRRPCERGAPRAGLALRGALNSGPEGLRRCPWNQGLKGKRGRAF